MFDAGEASQVATLHFRGNRHLLHKTSSMMLLYFKDLSYVDISFKVTIDLGQPELAPIRSTHEQLRWSYVSNIQLILLLPFYCVSSLIYLSIGMFTIASPPLRRDHVYQRFVQTTKETYTWKRVESRYVDHVFSSNFEVNNTYPTKSLGFHVHKFYKGIELMWYMGVLLWSVGAQLPHIFLL